MGDTGTGKSSLIRQLLEQIADRGEAAIVYDPALEFMPQFYEPHRGDQILNPLDRRMPYWSPGDEVQHKAEALAFAKSLFPDDRRDNRFFIEAPRRVFARLLSFKPTAADIAAWLQTPAEIDRRLAGTELASMIDASAIPARRRPRVAEYGRRSLSADPGSDRDEEHVERLRVGARPEGMAVPHLDAAHAGSASASHQPLVRFAPDAPARRWIAGLGDSRRAADAEQVAEASRSARCGPEAERASGDRPSGTRPAGGAL